MALKLIDYAPDYNADGNVVIPGPVHWFADACQARLIQAASPQRGKEFAAYQEQQRKLAGVFPLFGQHIDLLGLYQQAAYDAAVEGVFVLHYQEPNKVKDARDNPRHIKHYKPQDMSVLAQIAQNVRETANVYFYPNLRRADLPKGKAGTKNDIVSALALVVEEDADKEEWLKLPPGIQPTAIIQSSFNPRQNRHFHYVFSRPVDPPEARELQRLAYRHMGGECGNGDFTKPYRVPDTFNHPDWRKLARGRPSAPQEVIVIGGSGERVDPDKLRAALLLLQDLHPEMTPTNWRDVKSRDLRNRGRNQQTTGSKKKSNGANGRDHGGETDRDKLLSRLTPVLRAGINNPCADGKDRSTHFFGVVSALLNFGLTDDEVLLAMDGSPCSEKYEGRLEEEIERVIEKWEIEQPPPGDKHNGGGGNGGGSGGNSGGHGGGGNGATPEEGDDDDEEVIPEEGEADSRNTKKKKGKRPRWPDVTEKGTPKLTSIANVKAALDFLDVHAWHNDFTCIPEIESSAGRHVMDDNGVSELWRRINALGFFATEKFIGRAWNAIAKEDRRHPIRDGLDGLVWDKTARLERLFIDYAGAPDTPYNRALGILIGVAMVRRIRKPGYKFDHVILLRGPQDIAKSLFWQTLASPAYFTDNFDFGLSGKEIIEQTARKWLVEVAEMRGLTAKQIGHIRAMVTRQVDSSRMAYGLGMAQDFPRQFVVVGTVNEYAFLHDQHGNRRFDIIDVTKIDIERLKADRAQIFAEANELEKTYGYLVLPDAVKADAKAMQDAALVRDHQADDIEDALAGRYGFVSRDDVYMLVLAIGRDHPKRNDREVARVVKETVSRLGWTEAQLAEVPRLRGYARVGPKGEGKTEERKGSPRWTRVVINSLK